VLCKGSFQRHDSEVKAFLGQLVGYLQAFTTMIDAFENVVFEEGGFEKCSKA
jgi:hypothetical protein